MDKRLSFIEIVTNARIEQLAQTTEFEKYDPFAQNFIKKYNVDYKSCDGFKKVVNFQNCAIMINYMGNIHSVIVKRYLENKHGKPISDEELYEYIDDKKVQLMDNITSFPFDENTLTVEDRAEIWKNMGMLWELYIRNVFLGCLDQRRLDALANAVKTYSIKLFANKRSCIENLRKKKILDELGLQEYIQKVAPELLQLEVKKSLKDEMLEKFFGDNPEFIDRKQKH